MSAPIWSDDDMLAEARRWHTLVGEWPTSTDWHHHYLGRPAPLEAAHAAFFAATGPWPWQQEAARRWGSWGAFIAAAGGTAPGRHRGRHTNRVRDAKVAALRAATP